MILPLIATGGGLLMLGIGTSGSGGPGEPASPSGGGGPLTGGSGIDLSPNEIEALARVIASEVGSYGRAEQLAVGWTVRNRFRGKSIYAVEYPWREQKGGDPPFSSRQAPTDLHRAVALQILSADQSVDPTGGATAFFEPRVQDIAKQRGDDYRSRNGSDMSNESDPDYRFRNYRFDADEIRAKWARGGDASFGAVSRIELWGSPKVLARTGGLNTSRLV